MKSAVIFDMDGVLVDSEQVYFDNLMTFMRKISIEPFSRDINDYVGASTDAIWRSLIPNGAQRREVYREYIEFGRQHPLNYAELLKPGAESLLQFICSQNMKIALASAGRPADINQMLDDCHLREYFDSVISGESVVNNKPAPDIYLRTVEQLEVSTKTSLVVEDSEKGIEAAVTAGIDVWAVKQQNIRINQTHATRIMSGLPEVQESIRKMVLDL